MYIGTYLMLGGAGTKIVRSNDGDMNCNESIVHCKVN